MFATPKVSVITPTYTAARYIGQAIESVQAQTLTDWEMIIVDDALPDETAEVVKCYLDDPRIRLIRSERNRGECGARNLALEAAQGEWVAPLDADDTQASEKPTRGRLATLCVAVAHEAVYHLSEFPQTAWIQKHADCNDVKPAPNKWSEQRQLCRQKPQ